MADQSKAPDHPIDQRTGLPYAGTDWGHGLTCTCQPCLSKTTSDLIEAGILGLHGVDSTGVLLLDGVNDPPPPERKKNKKKKRK